MTKKRSEISEKYFWDISKIFSSIEDWKDAYSQIKPKDDKNKWVEIYSFKGKLKSSPQILASCLNKYFEYLRKIEKLYIYSHLLLDVDLSNSEAKNICGLVSNLFSDFQSSTAWIEPEILSIEQDVLKKYLKERVLGDFIFFIEKLINLKPHTLSEDQEKILARSNQVLQVCELVFSSFNNADIKFADILDKDDNKHPLTHGLYQVYLKSVDRILRKNAFEKMHEKFKEYENTLTELFYGEIKNSFFVSETKKYESSLNCALFPNNIDTKVYLNLIQSIKDNISSLHNYISLKKERLKVDSIHIYDLYVPISKDIDFHFTYDNAKELIIESTEILGKEYQDILKRGINQERWIDVYETVNKKSGGYSSGCYDTYPYILLNYQNTLNDALTLAHECGHSMHTFLSNKKQKYWYSSYPIFLAEIASTLNELLFLDLLLKRTKKEDEKKYLISSMIDRINSTIFRQTLFADFELQVHNLQKENVSLTPELLKNKYSELYKFYYGKDFFVDDLLAIEWARIPHFYSPFYVYQYATGISIAISIFNKIKSEKNYKDKYLTLLKSGGSDYPLNILKKADIDITQPNYIKEALQFFDDLIKKI
jgi:oligoendopeptidase F